MAKRIEWDRQIGRRLKLRDLHVFITVARRGSMAKAAAELGVSQPVVSAVVADLEHVIGVRLFDRSTKGVEPTLYGEALLKGGIATFDDLTQTIKEIEFLADPSGGEVKNRMSRDSCCNPAAGIRTAFTTISAFGLSSNRRGGSDAGSAPATRAQSRRGTGSKSLVRHRGIPLATTSTLRCWVTMKRSWWLG